MVSKSQIDKAGKWLSNEHREYDEEVLGLDYVFDDFRKGHLEPLTRLTLKLQNWLAHHGDYYIAQRLKRKPQILRKLRRISVRLTQLQDIGGCRIIVNKNKDVDEVYAFLSGKLKEEKFVKVIHTTDYREKGRDDSGYRALHIILEVSGKKLELQLRSRIQHYWAESIERTSVIYGYHLKEQEGDQIVIKYFKAFSDRLYDIENGKRNLSPKEELKLETQREVAESIIDCAASNNQLSGYVNKNIIKQMAAAEKDNFNNWILVFDWSDGNFVTWDMVGRNPDIAVQKYLDYEKLYKENEKKEVVMIGTSDVETIQHTHSHYFGIANHNAALEGMEKSIIGLSKRSRIDTGARRILIEMVNKKFWSSQSKSLKERRSVKVSTLKNHFVGGSRIEGFDDSLRTLCELRFILADGNTVFLNLGKKHEIDELI